MAIPDKPSLDGLEQRWAERWEADGVYQFDRSADRERVFAIDTPPPTASGSLHVGSVFSYTHTDLMARYQRMRGREVFYPMGWDDNGLPTERRVQNYFGIRCDPSLPYDPGFTPPAEGNFKGKIADQVPTSRQNFIELCVRLATEDERAFGDIFRRLGLSVDWRFQYQTVSADARAVSQRAFLRNLARGEAYAAEAPTAWDVTFRTAVSQAEMEDRERDGAYHAVAFAGPEGDVVIETTRPELLPACVALVAHPDDERYQPLFGKTVTTPLFGVEVPVVGHRLAEPGKGSGIAMICTFGDLTDVTWWRELQLPTRPTIGVDGRLLPEPPAAVDPDAYSRLAGKTVFSAQQEIVAMLRESGALRGEPKPIKHPVRFYEKGERPLEIVTTRQWYIRNGGRDAELCEQLIDRGRQIDWHPSHMQVRYEHWVTGLTGDWLISRQRFFGVPFPVWYAVADDGSVDYDRILLPSEDSLPVDPSSDCPSGYQKSQRGQPGGFVGDPDIMDTWATSSLTPQIAGGWERDPDLFARVFPMHMRPQAHDIIRTWLFATVVRSHFEHGEAPWSNAAISGFILDPDRKKIGKSTGNAITPVTLFDEFGSDAVRYWSASARLGSDAAFDTGQMKIGRRLAIKLLNASKFVLSFPAPAEEPGLPAVTEPLDRSLLAGLARVVEQATAGFEDFNHSRALEVTEAFFWSFCDDYVELVKERAYGGAGPEGQASATATLRLALSVLLRLFAPMLPFVTEEVWSWWRSGSLHRTTWPTPDEVAVDGEPRLLAVTGAALSGVRKVKSEAKVSQRTDVPAATVRAPADVIPLLANAADDLRSAGRITDLSIEPVDDPNAEITVEATLAEPAA